MTKNELLSALQLLGELGWKGRVVVAGSAAAILNGWLSRTTADVDVIWAEPKVNEYEGMIAEVASRLRLPRDWINDSAKAWVDRLPPDFADRLEPVGRFGDLEVLSLGRRDLLVLKFFSFRAEDLQDIRDLEPTPDEIAFVRQQLERISRFDPRSALKVDLYLQEGDSDAGN